MRTFLALLFLFLAAMAAVWAVALALYRALTGEAVAWRQPVAWFGSAAAVFLAALLFWVPQPCADGLTLAVWWVAARHLLGLSPRRSWVLVLLLAALSYVARLALVGAASL